MQRVDAFIIADQMQYTSSGWTHRNRVRGPHGAHWLTLPARPKYGQAICDVRLDTAVSWAHEHLTTLRHFYGRSPYAAEILGGLGAAMEAHAERLVDASMPVLQFLIEQLGITTPLVVSSQARLEEHYAERFPGDPSPTHRIIAFMEVLGATRLLEAQAGETFLDVELFRAHGIEVEFQHYAHPIYPQLYDPFMSHLSVLDLLLCHGRAEARRIIASVS